MKFRIYLLLAAILFLPACMSEGNIDCPNTVETRTVVLKLAYDYDHVTQFTNRIERVDVYIFDKNTGLFYDRAVWTTGLRSTEVPSVTLDIALGEYEIVAWANVTPERSTITDHTPGGTSFGDMHIGRPSAMRNTNNHYPADGDRLHFANRLNNAGGTLVVTPVSDVADVITLSRAFLNIDVYVVGLGEEEEPFVLLGNANALYNFSREPHGSIDLGTESVWQYWANGDLDPALASFRIKLFDETEPARELRVFSGKDQREVAVIDDARLQAEITAFMARPNNQIQSLLTGTEQDVFINVLITFQDGGETPDDSFDLEVSITVERWRVVDTGPILPF